MAKSGSNVPSGDDILIAAGGFSAEERLKYKDVTDRLTQFHRLLDELLPLLDDIDRLEKLNGKKKMLSEHGEKMFEDVLDSVKKSLSKVTIDFNTTFAFLSGEGGVSSQGFDDLQKLSTLGNAESETGEKGMEREYVPGSVDQTSGVYSYGRDRILQVLPSLGDLEQAERANEALPFYRKDILAPLRRRKASARAAQEVGDKVRERVVSREKSAEIVRKLITPSAVADFTARFSQIKKLINILEIVIAAIGEASMSKKTLAEKTLLALMRYMENPNDETLRKKVAEAVDALENTMNFDQRAKVARRSLQELQLEMDSDLAEIERRLQGMQGVEALFGQQISHTDHKSRKIMQSIDTRLVALRQYYEHAKSIIERGLTLLGDSSAFEESDDPAKDAIAAAIQNGDIKKLIAGQFFAEFGRLRADLDVLTIINVKASSGNVLAAERSERKSLPDLSADRIMHGKHELTPEQADATLRTLEMRFRHNMHLHKGVDFDDVRRALETSPEVLWSVAQMEASGHEPDVYHADEGYFYIGTCSVETPESAKDCVYDEEIADFLRQNRPRKLFNESAVGMAHAMGAELMPEEHYRDILQKKGERNFDRKSRSWLFTPGAIRLKGYAIVGHGSDSHSVARQFMVGDHNGSKGFRCVLRVPNAAAR